MGEDHAGQMMIAFFLCRFSQKSCRDTVYLLFTNWEGSLSLKVYKLYNLRHEQKRAVNGTGEWAER